MTPKSSKGRIERLEDGTLKIFVQAPAVNGRANEAAIRLVAKWLRVPPRAVSIIVGHRNRRKVFQIEVN